MNHFKPALKFLVFSFVLSAFLTSPSWGKTTWKDLPQDQQNLFRETAQSLRCPTCTGISVLESDAPFSEQMKQRIQSEIEAGKSKDEIVQLFSEKYGLWILREPPKTGLHSLLWIIPFMLLLAISLLLIFLMFKRKKTVPRDTHEVDSSTYANEFQNLIKEQRELRRGDLS